jgi:hypothetical protein
VHFGSRFAWEMSLLSRLSGGGRYLDAARAQSVRMAAGWDDLIEFEILPALAITEHPTATWTAQQIIEAFPNDTPPGW